MLDQIVGYEQQDSHPREDHQNLLVSGCIYTVKSITNDKKIDKRQ
jgi:hypothetical protein